MTMPAPVRWLLLIHHLPPKPPYFRVKIWRRLQVLGAVPVKSSVYVLPLSEDAYEDFQWLLREIVAGGGEGTVCEARFTDGLSDGQVEELFRTARDEEYRQLTREALELATAARKEPAADGPLRETSVRFRRRFTEITGRDFFAGRARAEAEKALVELEGLAARIGTRASTRGGLKAVKKQGRYRGRIWVTRRSMQVDRIASAWLIRRFIDPDARFKWVTEKDYKPRAGEVRFDMFEAEFTHVADRCTFEVLIDEMKLADRALVPIREIVHDLDLKDGKFGRAEAAGIRMLLSGIATPDRTDEDRLQQGAELFDRLYDSFREAAATAVSRKPARARKSTPRARSGRSQN